MKRNLEVGDEVKCWRIVDIYLKDIGSQKVRMAKVESTINDKIGEYRLTLLTNEQVGYPDRRRPDLSKRNTTHGMSKTRLYSIWYGMQSRCYNKKQPSYQDYGAKGINICKEWLDSFIKFKDWAETNGYREDLTIDRIDVTKDYKPSNCRWSDWKTQSYNRSNRKSFGNYDIFGEVKSLYEWYHDDRCVVSLEALRYRISVGWDLERALTEKSERKSVQFNLQKFYVFVEEKYPHVLQEFMEKKK
jgi:hypothetical protein